MVTFCNISDFVPPSNATSIHLVSHHIQILLITLIILVCVLANLLIISNIINCDIKSRIISFQLIKYLCFVDLIGACTVLPIPLAATIQGDYVMRSTILQNITLRILEPGTSPVLHKQLHHDGDLDGAHDHVRHAQGG